MSDWAKGQRFSPMAVATLPPAPRSSRPLPPAALLAGALVLALLLALAGQRLIAQIEGERGILPVATSSDIQADGIEVETTGKTAQEAREAGWKLAQKKGWEKLGGPAMGDSATSDEIRTGLLVAVRHYHLPSLLDAYEVDTSHAY